MSEFPKYVYTRAGAHLVLDAEQLSKVGAYYESPADVPAADAEPVEAAPVQPKPKRGRKA